MGTTEEAIKYLERGYYLGFTGYLCKVSKLLFQLITKSLELVRYFIRINQIPV